MSNTREGLLAELHCVRAIERMLPTLERLAGDGRLLQGLREALRMAHPACFDCANNAELHAEYSRRVGGAPGGKTPEVIDAEAVEVKPGEEKKPGASKEDVEELRGQLREILSRLEGKPVSPPDASGGIEGASNT